MNAQIGKNVNHKFSLNNSSSRNGEHQTDITLGGARGVVVIVVGIGHGDTSSNPGRD